MKGKIIFIFNWLSSCLKKVADKLNSDGSKKLADLSLESLAPKRTASEMSYSEIINAGIIDNDVKNIAITGSYGAGKSSVLKTFKEDFEHKYTFLNISLANFRCEQNEKIQSKIRLSILQQMFYHARVRKIPDSRFKRIKAFSILDTLKLMFVLFISMLSFFYLFQIDVLFNLPLINKINLYPYLDRFLSKETIELIFYSICWVALFVSLFYFLKKIHHAQFGIKEIKFNNTGLFEINTSKNESHFILNKYIDEILYLFERKKFDVVIIEDLDRFEEISIFEELRELNFLLNNAKQLKKTKITFIYALNDILFEYINKQVEKDQQIIKNHLSIDKLNTKNTSFEKINRSTAMTNKTKFFDLIIPVIPFINVNNSYDWLKNRNEKDREKKRLKLSFINKISFYINDMRLLTNIFNEYIIYRKQIIENTTDGLQLSYEQLFSIIIIKNFFPSEFQNLHRQQGVIAEIFEEKKNDFINEKLKERDDLDSDDPSINFDTYEVLTKKASVRDLLNTFGDIDSLLTGDKLVDYLIKYGYLTENYHYYISLFHKEGISSQDQVFLKQFLPNERRLEPTYTLQNCPDIYARLSHDSEDFGSDAAFNCDLIHYLILNRKNQNEAISANLFRIIKNLNKHPQEAFKLFDSYLKHSKCNESVEYFTNNVCRYWAGLWSFIQTENRGNNETFYLTAILKYSDYRWIANFGEEIIIDLNRITNFFTRFAEIKINRLQMLIEELGLCFDSIDKNIDSQSLIFLLNGEHYQITFNNLYFILNKQGLCHNEDKFKKYSFSIIKDSGSTPIIEYIYSDFDKFVSEVMCSNQVSSIDENENNVIELLNQECKKENKYKIIELISIKLTNLSKIGDKQIWGQILSQNRLITSWENVLYYYGEYDLDEVLTTYLKQKHILQELSEKGVNSELFINDYLSKGLDTSGILFSLSHNSSFLISVLNNDELSITLKEKIIQSIDKSHLIQNIDDIDDKDLWGTLFKENIVLACLDNVLNYYEQSKELDENLICYLNDEVNYNQLSKFKLELFLPGKSLINKYEFDAEKLLIKFLTKETISTHSCVKLLDWFKDIEYSRLNIDNNQIDNGKLAIAIDKGLLALTSDSYEQLRTSDSVYFLIKKNTQKFLVNMHDYNISSENISRIIDFRMFSSIEDKLLLLRNNQNETANFIENDGISKLVDSKLLENKKFVIELLNNDYLGIQEKESIIKELQIKIDNINDVTNLDIQSLLFKFSKINASWINVYGYYLNNSKIIDNSLIDFFNEADNTKELSKLNISKSLKFKSTQEEQSFQRLIMTCDQISDDCYLLISRAIWLRWSDLNIDNLSAKKIDYLIKTTQIDLNVKHFSEIKTNFPQKQIDLLDKYSVDVLKFTNNISELFNIMSFDDFELLLNLTKFNSKDKIKIINKIPENTLKNNVEFVNKLLKILRYDSHKIPPYSIDLLIKLFKYSNSEVNKLKLIIKNLDKLSNQNVDSLLATIPILSKIVSQNTSTIPSNSGYQQLFEKLKEKGYLKKYHKNKKKKYVLEKQK